MSNTLKIQLKHLWSHIKPGRRKQFIFLLILMFLTSFAEIVSIGSVLPFLGILTSPELVFSNNHAQPIIRVLGISRPEQLILPLTILFGMTAIISGGMRLLLLWSSIRLSFTTGADLSVEVYRRTLYQPYSVHCNRNSGDAISGISGKTNTVIYGIIIPLTALMSSVVILVAILVMLAIVVPSLSLVAFGFFGVVYALIILKARRSLFVNGKIIAVESSLAIKALQEGFGGIRDVLLSGNQETYCRIYQNADLPLRRAQGNNQFIGQGPRYAIEAFGMLLFAVIASILSRQPDGIVNAIPVLGALALGAQRLLPVMQQAYVSWSSIQGGRASLQDILDLLAQPIFDNVNSQEVPLLQFNESIRLNNISFNYEGSPQKILSQVDLTILKGSRVGFIGNTGSGKSTLLDLVMGLLQPTNGLLEVDGIPVTQKNMRGWQARIAHVPQSVYLSDNSIEENIAFGVAKGKIDRELVRSAAKKAQIADDIATWPEEYQTQVGERGIRLSGGQRQRIGIARALYNQADVIIFDEATSALDTETEQAVMQAIVGLGKDLTILIIAHRLTTLKNCTKIVELGCGGIHKIGTYQSIIEVIS